MNKTLHKKLPHKKLLNKIIAFVLVCCCFLTGIDWCEVANAATVSYYPSVEYIPTSYGVPDKSSNPTYDIKTAEIKMSNYVTLEHDVVDASGYTLTDAFVFTDPKPTVTNTCTNLLTVKYVNAMEYNGRGIDIEFKINSIKSYANSYGSSITNKYIILGKHTGGLMTLYWSNTDTTNVTTKKSSEADIDYSINITWNDTGKACNLDWYFVYSDIDIVNKDLSFQESMTLYDGFSDTVKMYEGTELTKTKVSYTKGSTTYNTYRYYHSKAESTSGNNEFWLTGLITKFTGNSVSAVYKGRKCGTNMNFYSPFLNISDPTKTVVSSPPSGQSYYQPGDTVTYRISRQINNLYKKIFFPYTAFTFSDTLPDGLTYKSAKMINTTTKKTVASDAGTLTVKGNSVTYAFSSTWLNNNSNYNGDTYALEISATVDEFNGTTKEITNTGNLLISTVSTDISTDITVANPALSIEKSVDKSYVGRGEELTYTITAKNTQKGTVARNTVLSDPLPDGFELVSASLTSGYGTVSKDSNSVTVKGDLSYGTNWTVKIVCKPSEDIELGIGNAKTYTNTATLTADSCDQISSSAKITVTKPNLTIKKQAYGDINGGYYKIIARNSVYGSVAKNAVVSDTLPDGLTLTKVEGPSDTTVSIDGNSFTVKGDLTNESQWEIYVYFTVSENDMDTYVDGKKTYTNTATVNADDSDPASSSVDKTMERPSLEITKEADGTEYTIDDTVTWTVEVTAKNADAHNLEVWDTVPDGLTLIGVENEEELSSSYNLSDLVIDGNEWRATFDCLDKNSSVPITFTARVDGPFESSMGTDTAYMINTAYASAQYAEDASVNSEIQIKGITPVLKVQKYASQGIAGNDTEVTYTITAKNTQKGTVASNAVLNDTLPDGFELISATLKSGDGIVSTNGNSVTVKGELPYGESWYLVISCKTSEDIYNDLGSSSSKNYENTATLNADSCDQVSDYSTVIIRRPYLEISKQGYGDITGGYYSILVKNTTLNTVASNTVVSDTLPDGLILTKVEAPSGTTVTIDGNSFTVEGNLKFGTPQQQSSNMWTIKAYFDVLTDDYEPSESRTYTNTATATSPESSNTPTATADLTITRPKALNIYKEIESYGYEPDGTRFVIWNVEVQVLENMRSLEIWDTMPDGITLLEILNADSFDNLYPYDTLEVNGNEWRATLTDVAEDSDILIQFRAKLDGPFQSETVTNTAYAYASGLDNGLDENVSAKSEIEIYPDEMAYQIETQITKGTITDSMEGISYGETKEVSWKADDGYYVDEVIVDGKSIPWGDTGYTDYSEGSYTFADISDNHTVEVVCVKKPTLKISKTVDGGEVDFRDGGCYIIKASTTNGLSAQNAVVSDTLPDGLTLTKVEAPSGTTVSQNGNSFAVKGDLEDGSEWIIYAYFNVSKDDLDSYVNGSKIYTNTATIDADHCDTVSSICNMIVQQPSLEITKVADNTEYSIGDIVTWTVEVTAKNGAVYDFMVTDTLPDGLTMLDIEAPGAESKSVNTGGWYAEYDHLDKNCSVQIIVTTKVDGPFTSSTVTNEASTYSDYVYPGIAFTDSTIQVVYQIGTQITNGTITDSIESINFGDTKEVSWKADDGYYVSEVVIDGESIPWGDTGYTDYSEGFYTFADIADNHTVEVVCEPNPSLEISKTAYGNITGGYYTILAQNTESGTVATNAVVSDTLPDGLILKDVEATSGTTVSIDGNSFTVEGDLVCGSPWTINVYFDISEDDLNTYVDETKTYSNTATIDADHCDTATATADLTVNRPSLEITKVADNTEYNVGDTVMWTVEVTARNEDVYNLSVSDELPEGLALVNIETTGECLMGANNWTATFDYLEEDCSVQIIVTARVKEQIQSSTITNTAYASAPYAEDVSADSTIQVYYWIKTQITNGTITDSMENINLGETKEVSWEAYDGYYVSEVIIDGESIPWGDAGYTDRFEGSYTFEDIAANHTVEVVCEPISSLIIAKEAYGDIYGGYYIITASGKSNLSIKNAVVSDTLPDGLILTDVEAPSDTTVSKNGNSFTVKGDLDYGESWTIYAYFDVSEDDVETYPDLSKMYRNTATLNADNYDMVTANADLIVKRPALDITKVADDTEYNIGDTVTWTVEVTSKNYSAENLEIWDTVPDGLTLLDIENESELLDGENEGYSVSDLVVNGNEWRATVDYLDEEYSVPIIFTARVDSTIKSPVITNTAYASAQYAQEVSADSVIQINGIEIVNPVLKLKKSCDKTVVANDTELTYTITAENIQKETVAYNAVLSDTLPDGFDLISATLTNGDGIVSTSGNSVTVKGELPYGETWTVEILCKTSEDIYNDFGSSYSKKYTNTATLNADSCDPVSSSANITVSRPDLSINKEAYGDLDGGYYRITAKNVTYGTVVKNAVVSDALPDGLILTDVKAPSDTTVSKNGNSFTVKGNLEYGTEWTVYAYFEVSDDDMDTYVDGTKTYTNTAALNADYCNTVTANADLTVAKPELYIQKNNTATYIGNGTYQIIVQNTVQGTVAQNAVVNDTLPDGLVLDEVTASISGLSQSLPVSVDGNSFTVKGDLKYGSEWMIYADYHVSEDDLDSYVNGSRTYTNTATVNADRCNTKTATRDTTIYRPTLDITKVADNTNYSIGDTVTWTVEVTAKNNTSAYELKVWDTVPDGLTLIGVENEKELQNHDGSSYKLSDLVIGGNEWCATFDYLYEDCSVPIVFTAKVDESLDTSLLTVTNTAYASAEYAEEVSADSVIQTETQTETFYWIKTQITNGTITDSMEEVKSGDTKEISWKADDGYYVDEVIVDGKSIPWGDTGYTDYFEGSYTFENISDNHAVEVVCEPIPTASITIVKYDGDGNTAQGVGFSLEGAENTYNLFGFQQKFEEKTTDANGVVTWDNLTLGSYTLTETKALEGYSLLSENINTIVPLVKTAEECKEEGIDITRGQYNYRDDSYYFFDLTYKVTNDAQLDMPESGSSGKYLWFLLLPVMAATAGTLFVYRKKKV